MNGKEFMWIVLAVVVAMVAYGFISPMISKFTTSIQA
jgi:hypothetical protein